MLLAGVAPASAQTRSVFLIPSNASISVGGNVDVAISIDNATGVSGFTFGLTFDPNLVHVTGVSNGTLTSPVFPTGDCLGVIPSIDNTAGAMCVSVACLAARSGGGTVAVISFAGVGAATGIAQLQFGPGLCPAPPPSGCSLEATGGGPPCNSINGSLAVGTTVAPAVSLAKGVGRPGGIACVTGTLAHDSAVVSLTSNDIGFEAGQFALAAAGCTINPVIGAGTGPNKQVTRTPLGAGSERVQVGGTIAALPDGLLYTCQFDVNVAATIGSHALTNTASAAGADGTSIAGTTGAGTQIVVTSCTGDCDGNGSVSIGEVLRCVNLFLGQPFCNSTNPLLSCPAADFNVDKTVSIGEVQRCVTSFLTSCVP